MKFSRLRLSGFKSFVDPTELHIEPGLTGVVGPNGCGKSNLLEAIRWVMGENRAKSLRGSGMDDVIFAGTDRRPARNMAEVTLVIDNFERTAPAEYNSEDLIEVTRRIERESGSAYRINGKDVRQKDVQLLFADAATGAHSPALVSQGRIGALINSKPQDRRAILEEAAGISGLHTRRKEAESRLRSAENNLVRVQDVIQSLEGQISSLRRQARQAVRYRTISGDIRGAEASLLFQRWKLASQEVIELERALREAEKVASEFSGGLAALTKAQTETAATIPPLREQDVAAAAALQRLNIEKENLEAETERRTQTALGLRQTLEQIAADRVREAEMSGDAAAALERLGNERERLESAQADQKDSENKSRETLDQAVREAGDAEASFDQISEQAAGARAQRSSLDSDRLAVNRRVEQIASELVRLESELKQLVGADENLSALKSAEDAVALEEKRLSAANEALEKAEQATLSSRSARSEADSAYAELSGQTKSIRAEVQGLVHILASEADDADVPVSQSLQAQEGYEKAVGAALGDAAEVGLDKEASRFWNDLSDTTGVKTIEGALSLSDVVTGSSALSRLFAATSIVNSAAEGDALMGHLSLGQLMVSKDGDLWRWDGYVERAGAPTAAALRLEQKNKLSRLQSDLEAIETRLLDLENAKVAASELHETARNHEQAQRTLRQDAEKALANARRHFVSAEQEASRRAGKTALIKETMARQTAERAEAQQRLDAIDQKLAALPDVRQLETQLGEARKTVEALRSKLSNARAAYDSLRREAEARSDRLLAIHTEAGAWEQRVNAAQKQLASLDERETSTKQQLAAVEAGPEELAARRDTLLEKIDAAEKLRKKTSDALVSAEADLAEKDKALRAVQEEQTAARERQIRADAAVENAANRRRDMAAHIGERFECSPPDLLQTAGVEDSESLPDISVLEVKLEKLKRERDTMGAVNLRADEELKEVEEQMSYLTSERSDLETAIARLRQAIASLNKEGRERLLTAFEIVNTHFGELFKTLFGGGEAHLKLTESDDPLDAGLEIFASPPGKRLQALSLLSGGEQALTALSLIFAVFITNPAPICVLDEVDAPLDDANVERFCNLLDEMMDRTDTRFLIVTHNAVSMARMKRLFGVTMAERGISTLVSVDLERAEALRDAS